jgi:hypothetical protein
MIFKPTKNEYLGIPSGNKKLNYILMKLKYFPYFLILVLYLGPLQAQQIRVSTSLERDSIWLGDQIKMIIVAEYPVGTVLTFPQLKDSLGNGVEILTRTPSDSSNLGNGIIQKRQAYLITAFDSGPHPITPFLFALKGKTPPDTLRSNPATLFVKVPPVDLKKGFADIKKPYGAPVTFKEIAPWILGILLLACVVFLVIYAVNRRKKNIPLFAMPSRPKLPPHVIALSELDKLKEEQLWQHDKVKDYYTRLTDIIRVYLEDRYNVPAMEQTTHEILADFKDDNSQIQGKLFTGLEKTLTISDLVKFAKYTPLPDENHYVLVQAYTLVDETKSEPVEQAKKQIVQPNTETDEKVIQDTNDINNQP